MSVIAFQLGVQKSTTTKHQLDEQIVQFVETYLTNRFRSIWTESPEELVMTYEDAVKDLTLDKSPGYPYYYRYSTKLEALEHQGEVIRNRVDKILSGDDVVCIFGGTEKAELRLLEKVNQHKTRLFAASDLHHLISSKILYEKQNRKLMDTLGSHPITIGIQIPGPQFSRHLHSLGNDFNDGDMDGCDQRFSLRIARLVRDIRHKFLPERYKEAGVTLYNSVYAGLLVILGNMYMMYGNKSGWENTGHDNSIQLWAVITYAVFAINGTSADPERIIKILVNGDDIVVSMQAKITFKEICLFLKQLNIVIEADNWLARRVNEIVYLSHHLEMRYVRDFGDFYVCAGNLNKLMSSVNWVKPNSRLSFEESCVAHLVGLRICVFPWAIQFEIVDNLLSSYLKTIEMTCLIRDCLKARFTELQLARMHTKVEGLFYFQLLETSSGDNQVLKVVRRLIKS